MAKKKTPKQLAIKIKSLKKQVVKFEKMQKAAGKKGKKKKVVKKKKKAKKKKKRR